MPPISLRPTTLADLPTLFQFQLDPTSNQMAGTKAHTEPAFFAIWHKILENPHHEGRVILENGRIVGSISCFQSDNLDHIGYWIDKPNWGRGIATRALALMIQEIQRRPLHATAARANAGSLRVLESNGFRLTGYFNGEETPRYIAGECASFLLE